MYPPKRSAITNPSDCCRAPNAPLTTIACIPYTPTDAERLRFIASARGLGFSLADIAEILAARDHGIAPCQRVLDAIARRLAEIDRRIVDLLALRDSLQQLEAEGASLPRDDVRGDHCVCYLLKTMHDTGQISIQKGDFSNV